MIARFWINRGADNEIRVKLAPGQTIGWQVARATDEGYDDQGERYTHEGDRIVRRWWSAGRDCDGRTSDGGTDACRLDELDAHSYEWEGATHTAPRWLPLDVYHRDYAAEAAGY